MKILQVILLIILISCSSTKELNNGVSYRDNELTPIQSNSKWGFVNEEGVIHIEPMYDSVGFFYNGIAKIKVGNTYGLIRKDNSYLIKPKYEKVDEFQNNYSQVIKSNKSKYIDSNGESISNPPLQGGYCWGSTVSIYKGVTTKVDDKYELVYEKRKRIDDRIIMLYDTTSLKTDTIIDYSNDYIQVVKDGKIGIIKFNHREPIKTTIKKKDLKYDSIVIANYLDGATKYSKVKSGEFWGIINEQGYETVKPKYKRILTDPVEIRNPIAVTDRRIYQNHSKLLVEYEAEKLGYIDIYGKEYFTRWMNGNQ